MMKRYSPWIVVPAMVSLLFLGLTLFRPDAAKAQPQQYPLVDLVANKIIQKYQQSTCEQLWEKKAEHAPPSPQEIRAIELLRGDPQLRVVFINKIAAPIANKMFECGMIP